MGRDLAPTSLAGLARLGVLWRVDVHAVMTGSDSAIRTRMIEGGLINDDENDGLALTTAGIELCKSLQHRVAADAQAAKILQQREGAESSDEVAVGA